MTTESCRINDCNHFFSRLLTRLTGADGGDLCQRLPQPNPGEQAYEWLERVWFIHSTLTDQSFLPQTIGEALLMCRTSSFDVCEDERLRPGLNSLLIDLHFADVCSAALRSKKFAYPGTWRWPEWSALCNLPLAAPETSKALEEVVDRTDGTWHVSTIVQVCLSLRMHREIKLFIGLDDLFNRHWPGWEDDFGDSKPSSSVVAEVNRAIALDLIGERNAERFLDWWSHLSR